MTNDPAFTIFTPLAIAMFCSGSVASPEALSFAHVGTIEIPHFLRNLNSGIMNPPAQPAGCRKHQSERLVWYTTPSGAPPAGSFLPNQDGRLLRDNCQRKMQEKSDL
ncbi:hypothetical protein ABIB80_004444 [Bradyrhizobium sp. i1.15.2]|uniref:hypothetical protein n=1 Tax=Bradyrhizobium sp. i1.15.2 TaxID=3156362 RepID=UPI00339B95B2